MTLALVAAMTVLPLDLNADEQPPKNDSLLALCVVACAGAAVGVVYIFTKKCKPKYYWLMDDDQPPRFWVGTTTRKQAKIEGWRIIGGPYETPQDAPVAHPSPTNTVSFAAEPTFMIKVQTSTNGSSWTTVNETRGEMEDFGYYPTNAGMFRIEMGL